MKPTLILLFCLHFWAPSTAQQNSFKVERYGTADGLTGNNTNALLQDSRGFLWIGSNNGLNRYDGRLFKKYNVLGKNGLTDLSVVCLAEDKYGNIWIGTQNGLNKLNPFTETITRFYEGNGPGTIPFKWCDYLYSDKQNKLWLSTEKGLSMYDESRNQFINYPVSVFGKDTRINKFISKIFEDSRNRFWLTTSYGIKLFNRETKTYRTFLADGSPEPASFPAISISEDPAGNLWAGTWGSGLFKYDETSDRFSILHSNNTDFTQYVISAISNISIQSRNYLVLGTHKGLVFADSKTLSVENISAVSDNTTQLLKDRQGNYWISGSKGLYKMNSGNLAFQWVPLPGSYKDPPYIFHIIPGTKPVSACYLSSINGWWKYDNSSGNISPAVLPPDPANLLGGINQWYAGGNGYWFTSVHGLGWYNPVRQQLKNLNALTLEKNETASCGILTPDNQGRLWITLRRNGILVYNPANEKAVYLFNDKSQAGNTAGNDIHDLKQGPDGFMYFTALNKLYKVNENDFSFSSVEAPLQQDRIDLEKTAPGPLFFSKSGQLFTNSNLQVYELKDNKLVTVFPKNGYPDFNIDKMYCTPGNIVWALTSKGIFKTDTTFRQWINISNRVGIPGEEFINELCFNWPGSVLITGAGRIGVLKDSLLQRATTPPPVLISTIRYGDQEKHLPSLQDLAIRFSYKNPVEMVLSPVNFINEKEIKIQYRLEGWDKEWKTLNRESVVRYEQLPPGNYTFTCKQINEEAMESSLSAVHFTITPPFYQSGWFIILVVLTAGALLYTIYRFRLKKALEMERMRTRIATDLHDDIGATLSSISMYSDALKMQVKEKLPHLEAVVNKIGDNSREMVSSISDIVWAINPDNDDAGKLLQRMENYARDLCAVKNTRLHFQGDDSIRNMGLPPEYRKNIYLVFKESLNNALKYAQAAYINISIIKKGSRLEMTIADDGKGFESNGSFEGNGLRNMKERAAEINGTLLLDTAPGSGTRICFSCTLP